MRQNFCMLYYNKKKYITKCKAREHAQHKPNMDRGMTFAAHKKLRYFLITHKLQKLFMSQKISKHMTWYHSHDADGVIMHLFDGET